MVTEDEVNQKIKELKIVEEIYKKERDNADIERYTEFYNARLCIIEEHLAVLYWLIGKTNAFEMHWENKEWLQLQRM